MGIILEPYNGPKTRFKCPNCGSPHKFTKYINVVTHEYLGDYVGRCDRENSCGYHFKPKDFYQGIYEPNHHFQSKQIIVEPLRALDYLPNELIAKTLMKYDRNNFYLFLESMLGLKASIEICSLYNIGTSKHWEGATVFWQKDIEGRVRQCKIMLYDPVTGRRVKSNEPSKRWNRFTKEYTIDVGQSDKIYFAGKYLLKKENIIKPNLQQCFFGEHLLQRKGKVAIVESEKTACISSYFFPGFNWIATGGSNGAGFTKPEVCRVLNGREIILFPDLGQYKKWSEITKEIKKFTSCKIVVSDLLEANAREIERANSWDLADYLLANNASQNTINEMGPSSFGAKAMQPESIIISIKNEGNFWLPVDGCNEF